MTDEKNKKDRLYKIIIAVLLVIILFMGWRMIVIKSNVDTIIIDKEQAMQQNIELENEFDVLMAEHERIKDEYSTLTGQLTEKDSLIQAYAEEIETLIASQADYGRIKRKLDYLRDITQGYVNQVDSLYRVNAQLKGENEEIRGLYEDEQDRANNLSDENENLENKVNQGAILRAYGISATTYKVKSNGKETITDKARRTDRINVCFTISENPLVDAGTKDIYIRIARPNGLIFTKGTDSFIYQGKRIQYTVKKTISYQQKAMKLCISWDTGAEQDLPVGVYYITVFADDQSIGEGSFSLN
jgi:hypothetical protein